MNEDFQEHDENSKIELIGGKKLGQGQQGCVISPPLGSKNENEVGKLFFPFTQDDFNKFSKIEIPIKDHFQFKYDKKFPWDVYSSVRDSKHEYEIGLKFLDIDLARDYGVYPIKNGFKYFTFDEWKNSQDVNDCFSHLKNKINNKKAKRTKVNLNNNLLLFPQIIYPKEHGDNFNSLPEYMPTEIYIKHLEAAKHLIKGIKYYQSKNLMKGDHHGRNVIYTGTYENPIKYKFIDFGYSVDLKNKSALDKSLYISTENEQFRFMLWEDLFFKCKLAADALKNSQIDEIMNIGDDYNEDRLKFLLNFVKNPQKYLERPIIDKYSKKSIKKATPKKSAQKPKKTTPKKIQPKKKTPKKASPKKTPKKTPKKKATPKKSPKKKSLSKKKSPPKKKTPSKKKTPKKSPKSKKRK